MVNFMILKFSDKLLKVEHLWKNIAAPEPFTICKVLSHTLLCKLPQPSADNIYYPWSHKGKRKVQTCPSSGETGLVSPASCFGLFSDYAIFSLEEEKSLNFE